MRGAALANLRVDHPDILKFIDCKSKEGDVSNFNLSVAMTDAFMDAASLGGVAQLKDHNGEVVKECPAPVILDKIIDGMWNNGEPGLQFIDTVNRVMPVSYADRFSKYNTGILTSNPCSEAFLRSWESCILGALNLYLFVETPYWKGEPKINMEELKHAVIFAVEFLNRVVDKTVAPLPTIDEITRQARKIGIGVMGLADMLSALGIAYDSEEGYAMTERVLSFIQTTAEAYSIKRGYANAMLTLIAPTGTTGLVANVSQGIEPHFRLMYERNSIKAGKITMMCRSLSDAIDFIGSEGIREKIVDGSHSVTICGKPVSTIWPTAESISPEAHVKMLEVVQRNVHNGVSKTINLPNSATKAQIKLLIFQAWKAGIKGLTVYRDGSRNEQVLSSINTYTTESPVKEPIPVEIAAEAKRFRPVTTIGSTTKVKIGCGNLYVTTNADSEGACEVFTHLGRSGGCPSQSEATARLISLCLRSGVNVEEVSEQLTGIRCLSTIASGKAGKLEDGTPVLSCPDAIGKCLNAFRGRKSSPEAASKIIPEAASKIFPEVVNKTSSTPKVDEGKKCPQCGAEMQLTGGCRVCNICAYGKCG